MSSKPIRVLVVDDSAFARGVIRDILSADARFEVIGIARDGLDALEKIQQLVPDVVTLDLVMPNLDGLGVLSALAGRPSPRVVIVSMSDLESDIAIEALQSGAVDIVHKPTGLATDRLFEMSAELLEKVAIAATATTRAATIAEAPPSARAGKSTRPLATSAPKLVVLGTSTGGPQALTRVLSALPADFPVPIAIALHMPVGYTAALSERLDRACAIRVVEAHDGLALVPGMVAIARAGMHLKIDSRGDALYAKLDFSPFDKPHRPSVDVLFASAAAAIGERVLGVVLTGMGEDGLLGARAIHAAGGKVFHEAEQTCVVYGMPRAISEAGISTGPVPLDAVAGSLLRRVVA